ncbi:histidine kinase [Candidatus Moduliflexus flocculans]|uniref:histidine kinase n=1 Tax=Candidatus Moduliflexus flocculans TaxID=1499966 RepID=A0A081BQ26_9BACT|nr:histidine kinase [Candidatus Moduliflexus flocculans]
MWGFLTVVITFISLNAQAREETLTVRRLSGTEAFSDAAPQAIMQDRAGFIWIGMADGLKKFDGYSVLSYRQAQGLANLSVTALFQDTAGALWVGTDGGGLYRFDSEQQHFIAYRHDPHKTNSLSDDHITALAGDQQHLWVGTTDGLNAFDLKNATWTRYRFQQENPQSLSHSEVTALCVDRNGGLWVGTIAGLNRFEAATGTFTRYTHDLVNQNSLSSNRITAVQQDRLGMLWIGTADGGVNRFDPAKDLWHAYRHDEANLDSLTADQITSVLPDRDGIIWIGTEKTGVNRLDTATDSATAYIASPGRQNGLSSNAIRLLFQDRGGLIWVSSDAGLDLFSPNALQTFLQQYTPDPQRPTQSLSGDFVTAVAEDREGMLWIGTANGLNRLDQQRGTITQFHHQEGNSYSLNDEVISALLEDRRENLWVGTWQKGLNRFDRQAGQFISYTHDFNRPNSLSDDNIFALYEDREGTLWVGTRNGLNRHDAATDSFAAYVSNFVNPASGPADNRISAIYEDREGVLWIGTWRGLSKFDRAAQTFTHYRHDSTKPNSLIFDSISGIFEDSTGTLWVMTWQGTCRFDRQNGTCAPFGEQNGLAGGNVKKIHEDRSGNLWLTTDKGISRLNLASGKIANYSEDDGLPKGDMLYSGVYTSWGRLFLGSSNGLIAFFPDRVAPNEHIPPIALTAFTRFAKNGEQERSIPTGKTLELRSTDSGFSFEFAALDYAAPNRNQYAYRLEGVSTEWIMTGSKRTVEQFNPGVGEYTFSIKGSNNQGVWNETGLQLRVKISPVWWQTWWARTLFGLAALAVVSIAPISYSLAQMRARKHAEAITEQVRLGNLKLTAARNEAERHAENLRVVNDVGRQLTSEIHLAEKQILELIYQQLGRLMDNRTMYIALYDESRQRLTFPLAVENGKRKEYPSRIVELDEAQKGGLTEEVIRTRAALNLSQVETFCQEKQIRLPVAPIPKSWMGVPMIAENNVIGVITLLNDEQENAYSSDDLEVLQILTAQAAVAIENARLYEQVSQQVINLEAANRRIAETQDMLTRSIIATDFVHRLNNLAGTIPIWVDMISEELQHHPCDCTEVRNYLDNISTDTDKLLRAAEQLKISYRETAIDMVFVLQSMLRQVRIQYNNEMKAGHLRIVEQVQPDLHKVWGRSPILANVIYNVISNALEAIFEKGGGTLTVTAVNDLDARHLDVVRIDIADTGVGIAKDDLSRIFATFFSTKGEGRGYGLWRTKSVIENLGGHIDAESEEGVGSVFTIFLPHADLKLAASPDSGMESEGRA